MSQTTAVNNYEYLDILDRAWAASRTARPSGPTLCDVGCASFWYAAALQTFFMPRAMTGVDVEGHRLFRNGHTRIDYAGGYLARLPNARFLAADYRQMALKADVITLWFPFVTAQAILAWRLPLNLLDPEALMRRVSANLEAGGMVVMVNHGPAEARVAHECCVAAGLRRLFEHAEPGPLSAHRSAPAILSAWMQE